MNISINGKDVELKFGIGFVRDMDKRKEQEVEGMKFGVGLTIALELIDNSNSIDALLEVVQSAIKHEGEYTIEEIITALEELNEEEQAVFLESLEQKLKTSPVVQASYQKMKKMMMDYETKENKMKVVK